MMTIKEFYGLAELVDKITYDLTPFEGFTNAEENTDRSRQSEEVSPAFLDPDFPIAELSPPIIRLPLYACSEAVSVTGTLKGAIVRLFVEGSVVGENHSQGGDVGFSVKPLIKGQKLTVTQTFEGQDSPESFPAAIVEPHPERLPQPIIKETVFECGTFAVVEHCLPGSRVRLFVDDKEVDNRVAYDTRVVLRSGVPLKIGQKLVAITTLCEASDAETLESDPSPEVFAQKAPSVLPQPKIDTSTITIGNNRIYVSDCLYNARATLTEEKEPWSGSYNLISSGAWFGFSPGREVKVGDVFSIIQGLCTDSAPSPKVVITDEPHFQQLPTPKINEPVCPGERIIEVSNCRPGAVVVVLKGNQAIAVTTAGAETVWLAVAKPSGLQSGDKLVALQYINNIKSAPSAQVTVQANGAIEIDIAANGVHVNEEGEVYHGIDQIDTRLLHVRVKTCCKSEEGQTVAGHIRNADNIPVQEVFLQNYGNGLYEGYVVTFGNGLPAGRYTMSLYVPCHDAFGELPFDVVITKPNLDDRSPPSVSMKATTQTGSSANVTSTRGSNSGALSIVLGEFIDISAEANDRDGLQGLQFKTTAGRTIGQIRRSNRGVTPIPIQERLSLQVTDLPLGQTFFTAEAENFGSTNSIATTEQIVVDVRQPTPVLHRVSSSGRSLTVEGAHLNVPGEPTAIVLSRDGSVIAEIAVPSNQSNPTRLSGIVVPPGVSQGGYDISVKVGSAKLSTNEITYFLFWADPVEASGNARMVLDAVNALPGRMIDSGDKLTLRMRIDSGQGTAIIDQIGEFKATFDTRVGENTTTIRTTNQPITGTFDPHTGALTARLNMRYEHSHSLANVLGGGSDLNITLMTGQSVSYMSVMLPMASNLSLPGHRLIAMGKSTCTGGILDQVPTVLILDMTLSV